VSLGISLHLKKKVRSGCALPGGDMQKPYVPKCRHGKTKIAHVQVVHFIPVKVSTLYIAYKHTELLQYQQQSVSKETKIRNILVHDASLGTNQTC
jgi:hypothetical protein